MVEKKKKVVYFACWVLFREGLFGGGGGYCWGFCYFFTLFAYKSVQIWFVSE